MSYRGHVTEEETQQRSQDVLFKLKLKGVAGSDQSGLEDHCSFTEEEQPIERPRIRESKEV